MSETTHGLDDKYTEGIWYDLMSGDFAKIQRNFDPKAEGNGRIVELVNPETDNVYYDMPVEEWADKHKDFCKVSDEAVEDPVAIVNRALRVLSRNNINELSGVPMQEAIDLRYARRRVDITEQ